MTDKTFHDLAIAYAQTKLLKYQQEFPDDDMTNDEIRAFLKSYHFALIHMPEEEESIDLSTLM